MPQIANRVQEITTTGGTGTLTLAGAVTGYLTFASGFSTSDVLFYTIDNGVGEWEIGIGTLVTTGTLSRDTVIASSNGGSLVNFSSGTKRVFCSAPTRALVPDQDSKGGFILSTDGTDPIWTQTLNGVTIGNTSPGTGAFTTLSASSTVSGAGFSTYLASPPAIGGTVPAAGSFTTLSASSTVTLSAAGQTANGVAYLNASKQVTTGTGLVFDGTNLLVGTTTGTSWKQRIIGSVRTLQVGSAETNNVNKYSLISNLHYTNSTYTDGHALIGGESNNGQNFVHIGGFFGEAIAATGIKFYTAANNTTTSGSERLHINYSGTLILRQSSNAANTSVSFNTTIQNALTLDSSGNFGIGATSLNRKLYINTTSVTDGIRIVASDVNKIFDIEYDLSNNIINVGNINSNGYGITPLTFWTFEKERLRIEASGNLILRQSSNAANTSVSFNTTVQNALTLDSSGNWITYAPTTAPTLSVNSTMVFNLTSNTNLRISVRGSDGTTRTANITLA